MSAKPIISKSNPRLKWMVLSAGWILSLLILIILSTNNEWNTLHNEAVSVGLNLRPSKNQIGAFGYIRRDPNENYRPIYSVHFKNLRAENNKLGIFKTALYKVVKIQGLEMRFYRYPCPEVKPTIPADAATFSRNSQPTCCKVKSTTSADTATAAIDITADIKALIRKIMRKSVIAVDGWRINNIDLSNVSEIRVNDFDYREFYNNDLCLSIQSKRAIASNDHFGVVLRGHVTIKTAGGSTLESNYVKWDLKNQYFSVNGVYVLNRGGIETMGEDICVDTQLNNVKIKYAELRRKEKQECFAKL